MKKSVTRTDLNLIKVLYVLLEERSVTRAAERLFVTQPAVSRSLNKLRQMFNDPLLVRSSRGLILTARAEDILAITSKCIHQMEELLEPSVFDPRTTSGVLRLAAPESFVALALPKLTSAIKEAAPNLTIQSFHLPVDYLQQLEDGRLDLVINHDEQYADNYISQALMDITTVCWFRKGHPLEEKEEVSLADFCSYPFVGFHTQNVNRESARLLYREITNAGLTPPEKLLDASQLLVTLDVLQTSNATMMGLDCLGEITAFQQLLVWRPLEALPSISRLRSTIVLIQHERTAHTPLYAWVAEAVRGVFTNLSTL